MTLKFFLVAMALSFAVVAHAETGDAIRIGCTCSPNPVFYPVHLIVTSANFQTGKIERVDAGRYDKMEDCKADKDKNAICNVNACGGAK